jgi:hypothetical protein
MSIFSRDYFKLTDDEIKLTKEYDRLDAEKSIEEMIRSAKEMKNPFELLELVEKHPFLLNVASYFPNNFLNEPDIAIRKKDYKLKLENFELLLNKKDTTERNILNFIKDNEAHFIIGSILKNYTVFGHHDRYIFPEFQLPPNFQVDFLIVGKNSNGYHFVFVELENPSKNVTIGNGSFGQTIRKGIEQVADWKHWNDKNFSTLRNIFDKHRNPTKSIPREFLEYDNTRMNYVVVAGRRDDFNEKTYRLTRESRNNGVIILHYDNVIDECGKLLKDCAY